MVPAHYVTFSDQCTAVVLISKYLSYHINLNYHTKLSDCECSNSPLKINDMVRFTTCTIESVDAVLRSSREFIFKNNHFLFPKPNSPNPQIHVSPAKRRTLTTSP